MAMSQ